MTELLTSILVLSGALLMLAAGIGVLRLPDVLCRSHAVAKAMPLGIFLLLLGLWVDQGERQTALKILLAIFFQVLTIPIGSHLLGLQAFRQDIPRWRHRPLDDHRLRNGNTSGVETGPHDAAP